MIRQVLYINEEVFSNLREGVQKHLKLNYHIIFEDLAVVQHLLPAYIAQRHIKLPYDIPHLVVCFATIPVRDNDFAVEYQDTGAFFQTSEALRLLFHAIRNYRKATEEENPGALTPFPPDDLLVDELINVYDMLSEVMDTIKGSEEIQEYVIRFQNFS